MFAAGRHFPTMDGKAIFKLAVRRLPEVTVKVLKKAGVPLDEVTLFIPHQANLRINQFFAKAMELPQEKVFNNIQKYGNTTAATIPLALDEAMEEGLIGKSGDVAVFLGGEGDSIRTVVGDRQVPGVVQIGRDHSGHGFKLLARRRLKMGDRHTDQNAHQGDHDQ